MLVSQLAHPSSEQHHHHRRIHLLHRRPQRLSFPPLRRPRLRPHPRPAQRPLPIPRLPHQLRHHGRHHALPRPPTPQRLGRRRRRRRIRPRRHDPQAPDQRLPQTGLRLPRPPQPGGVQHVRSRGPPPPSLRVRQHGLLRVRGPRELLRISGLVRSEPGRAPAHFVEQQSTIHEQPHPPPGVAAPQSHPRAPRQGVQQLHEMVSVPGSGAALFQNVGERRRDGRAALGGIAGRGLGALFLRLGRGVQYSAHAGMFVVFVSQDDGGVQCYGDDERSYRAAEEFVCRALFGLCGDSHL
mmetsp:Transcript_26324/g.55567  ORF Transcript_26324/g.55567 Transcript_26324/m.55567 type:complete len:296 (+) Transcript_26324:215-1102(+)